MSTADPANRTSLPGQSLARVEGWLKVTGQARYTAELPVPGLTHGVLLQSTIARGRVVAMDTAAAEKAPGVLGILRRENTAPPLQPPPAEMRGQGRPGEHRAPLADNLVHWAGQPLGVVVAETLEQAQHAAALVRVTYDAELPVVEMQSDAARAQTTEPEAWNAREKLQVTHGDPAAALAATAASGRLEADLHPAGRDASPDRAHRHHGGVGGTGPAAALRHHARHQKPAADRRRRLRAAEGKRARRLPLSRRPLRVERIHLEQHDPHRRRGPARRPAGAARAQPPGHVR